MLDNRIYSTEENTPEAAMDPIHNATTPAMEKQNIEASSSFPTSGVSHSDYDGQHTKQRSNLMKICCIALMAVLLFFIGLLTGHYAWEEPLSPPPIIMETTSMPHITVGTYYYPWHGSDFHRGDGYLRKFLRPVPQEPLLGEYDDTDPNVIAQHLRWSRRANINLWVTSWWGPDSREDETTRTVILDHSDLKDHQIALFYETFGRIRPEEDYDTDQVVPDMEHICKHYFNHPNYFRIDDRPVLFMYLTRLLDSLGLLKDVLDLMRQGVQDACGHDVYIVGDQIFGPVDPDTTEVSSVSSREPDSPFAILDAVTNYDVYGSIGVTLDSFGGYLEEDEVDHYYQFEQREWREIAKKQNCSYIPSVAPGYNDLGVRPEANHTPLARSLAHPRNDEEGSLFKVALKNARTLVDPKAYNVLMVNSFNEWHEDTQIEPTIGASTTLPYNLTYGVEYHGYGYLYLDILRNGTQEDEYYF
jgi:glycoprotein endo-alpha-1,2-mannosidase